MQRDGSVMLRRDLPADPGCCYDPVMRRLALLLISVVLLAVPATIRAADSRAADSAVPQADPPGTLRVMTFDDATTTSRCVGRIANVSCLTDIGRAYV